MYLLAFVLLFCNGIYAQTEFAPLGAEWYYDYPTKGDNPKEHFYHIISEKDTIVEGKNCRVLRRYYDNSNVANEEYIIKQEQGKIYYYYQSRFNLLFDFDAEVNDTVEFTLKCKKYANTSSYKDTILSVKFKIEDITTNAQNLKTFVTKICDENQYKETVLANLRRICSSYTEKIGCDNEFIPTIHNLGSIADAYQSLRCYSDADVSFISDWWSQTSLPCNYFAPIGINIPQKEGIKIYPNPFSYNIFVFVPIGGIIEIIDISGKIVYNSKLSNGINEISTNHLANGIYFVKIQENNRLQTFKIIKK